METDGKINKKRPPPPPVASGECIFPSCPVKLADAVMPDVIYGRLTSSKKECQLSAKECCTTLFDCLEKYKLHGRFLTKHDGITAIRVKTGNNKFAVGHTSVAYPRDVDKNLGKEFKHNIYCSNCYCTDHDPEKFALRVIGVISMCYEKVNELGEKVGGEGFEGEGEEKGEEVGVAIGTQNMEGFEGEGEEEDEKCGITNETQVMDRFEGIGEEKDRGVYYYRPAVKLLMVYPHSDQCNIVLSKRRNSKLDKEHNGRGWDTFDFPIADLCGSTYDNFVDKLKQTNWDIGDHLGEVTKL